MTPEDESKGGAADDPLHEFKGFFDDDLALREQVDLFFRGHRTIILPIDHGTAIPVPGLENIEELLGKLDSFIDGAVVNYGAARRFSDCFEPLPLCLRTDLYKPPHGDNPDPGPTTLFGADEAIDVEADAVMNMLYTHHPNEAEISASCADLIADCHSENIPVILETLPFGIGRPDDYTVDNIRFAVRAACELGADIVKTAYPGDKDGFASIVEEAFVPVVVLGGAAAEDDKGFLASIADAIEAGAAGIAIGRNVWQHPHPEKMAAALHEVVHNGTSANEAAKLLG